MKKYLIISLTAGFLGACAGNPPAWWNPGQAYSQPGASAPSRTQAVQPRGAVAGEESISLADDTYEEMTLTPLTDQPEEAGAENPAAPAQTPAALPEPLAPPSVLAE